MNFSSSVDVVIDEKNELFNAVSIYIPSTLAPANIVDFDPEWVTDEKPAVFTCVLDNYKEIMKGKLLDQWEDAFRQDTNVSAILYLIVFLSDGSTNAMWEIDDVSVKFKPLTEAFNKLYFISYLKVLFDESMDGKAAVLPPGPGSAASAIVQLKNTDEENPLTVPAGDYTFTDGVKTWTVPIEEPLELEPEEVNSLQIFAGSVGDDAELAPGEVNMGGVSPALPVELTITVISVTQGSNATTTETVVPSRYFDLSLALAYLCKLNLSLSYFISQVKVSYVDQKPNPADVCHIRLKTSAQEKEKMLSVKDNDRNKYYWGALLVMGCIKNTWVLAHSEPVNVVVQILAAWFASRNASGQYVGNKLSLLRLRGLKIKPLGFPSWLNSEVNENDAKGFDLLDEKNVGYLCTIADNTPQESCVSAARSIDGLPVAAQMISKWVDYTSSQQCAKLLTDVSTLTNPVLTNEQAYSRIQDILFSNLLLFTSTKRIGNIQMKFPPFSEAKVGLRQLVATGSWAASYSDDLDSVTVTGGIVTE